MDMQIFALRLCVKPNTTLIHHELVFSSVIIKQNLKSALVLARGPVLASSFARNTTVSGGLQPGDVPGSP